MQELMHGWSLIFLFIALGVFVFIAAIFIDSWIRDWLKM